MAAVAIGLGTLVLGACSGGSEGGAGSRTVMETRAAGADVLSFTLSGGLGGSVRFVLDDVREVVSYRYEPRDGSGADTARIRPSAAQWERFWATVERLGVWHWERRYGRRPPPPDATSWEVELEHAGQRVRSGGVGEGPAALTDLIDAFAALAGGRPF
jgi:hypothetical protein